MNQSVNFSQAVAASHTVAGQAQLTAGASPLLYWRKKLSLLLVVQILLVIAVFAWQQNSKPQREAQPLLMASVEDADKIIIRDATSSVTLQKANGTWQLPDLQNLPLDAQKLNELLDKLKGVKLTWPVATSSNSHERFEVGDSKFQRQIEWYQGDKKLEGFLLGSSPGFKKIHLRKQGDDSVYTVQLNSFEFATGNNDWLKKDLLALKEVQQIAGGDYSVQKNGDTWGFVAGQEKLDMAKVSDLVNAFSSLQVMELATEFPQGEKQAFNLKAAGIDYQFEFVTANNSYFVKRSDMAHAFKLSQYEYERIVKPAKADLIAKEQGSNAAADPINHAVDQATKGLLNSN